MKKLTSRLLLFITVLAVSFGLAACSPGKNNSKAGRQKEAAEDQEKQSEKEENGDKTQSDAADNKDKKKDALYDSIADYVNSDEIQSALNNWKSAMQEGVGIDIVAEDENKLVYVITYQTITHTEGDGMPEALAEASVSQDAVFQQTANAVKPFVGNDEVIVEIRYIDMNGTVIFSKSYTSEK